MNRTPQFTIERIQPSSGVLALVFSDGVRGVVDLQAAIGRLKSMRGIFSEAVFNQAQIADLGRSVIWPGNENWELAGDTLRAHLVDQAGGFSHARLIEWMDRNDLTLESAAEALGVSRRMLAYYRSGSKPIPRTVALACTGWEHTEHA